LKISRRIVVDSREQRPYDFENSVVRKLDAGDYSLEGLENCIAFERKSLDDYVGTLLRGKSRFSVELRKLQTYDFACVVIEGSLRDFSEHNYNSQLKPQALLGMTSALMLEYQPVHIIFAEDRPHAYALIGELFLLIDKRYVEGEAKEGKGF
jgi:ERCC4-type nuclease